MAAPILHQFTSPKSDGPDVTLVRPSNWNANHKASGGTPGQAVIWDAGATPENLAWGKFAHRNYTYNDTMELWVAGTAVAPTGWNLAGASATVARDAVNKKSGLYSAALTRVGTDCVIYQDVDLIFPGLLDIAKGQKVSFGGWARATTGGTTRLYIYDGVTFSFSEYHTGSGAFEFLKVEHTVSNSATLVRAHCLISTGNTTSQFDNLIFAFCGAPELSNWEPGEWKGRSTTIYLLDQAARADNQTRFLGVAVSSTTEGEVSFNVPYKCYARDLYANLNAAPAAGQNVTFTLRKDETTDTPLTATVNDAGTSASDLTHEVPLTKGQKISLKVVLSTSSGSRWPRGSFQLIETPEFF